MAPTAILTGVGLRVTAEGPAQGPTPGGGGISGLLLPGALHPTDIYRAPAVCQAVFQALGGSTEQMSQISLPQRTGILSLPRVFVQCPEGAWHSVGASSISGERVSCISWHRGCGGGQGGEWL